MNISGFTQESLDWVEDMLYAETQAQSLMGKCGQKALREQMKRQRTPAEEEGDRKRAQAQRGRNNISSSVRSEAAKKAAETRSRCKGSAGKTSTTTTV